MTKGRKAKADQAAREGRLAEAQALFRSASRTDPSDVEAWAKLSLIEKRLGRFQEAEVCARRALVLNPRLGFCHYAHGAALHSQARLPEAIAAYRQAIKLQPDFADTYYLLGNAFQESGVPASAIECFQKALALRPDFPEVLGNLGAVLLGMGELDASMAILQRALSLQPGNVIALGNMANALLLEGKASAALETYRHALKLKPDAIEIMAGLAGLLEKTGELNEAAALAKRGLERVPKDPGMNLVAAQLARRGKRFKGAADLLESVEINSLPMDKAADIEIALGQLYDHLDDPERAYALISSGNGKKARICGIADASRRKYLDRVAALCRLATPGLARVVSELAKRDRPEHPAPVFMIGFPRSGTTLLEQILDSHPAIQAMEEKGAVAAMVNSFLAAAGDQEDALAAMTEEEANRLRQVYFDEVRKHVVLRPGALLLDKLPLNTVNVPIILRIFPNAKFVLTLRHPCDASLSCLMQNFAFNEGMAGFFSLEDTVGTYSAVMGAWRSYVDMLPLDYHRVRYEDLIGNVEKETRALLEFLGLEWHEAVLKHTEHARQRGTIHTPSYYQVVQPIYQHAKYRWQRYEQQFAPVMAELRPFIRYFGYDELERNTL